MLISLVVSEPHETPLAIEPDDAVIAPPMVADDALSGPHTMSPFSVVFVLFRVILSEPFNWI